MLIQAAFDATGLVDIQATEGVLPYRRMHVDDSIICQGAVCNLPLPHHPWVYAGGMRSPVHIRRVWNGVKHAGGGETNRPHQANLGNVAFFSDIYTQTPAP